jgi:hypothetical protein
VFLRWGVLGILSVAALIYAYNSSKRLAEAHARKPAPAARTSAAAEPKPEVSEPAESTDTTPAQPPAGMPAHCAAELLVASRALEMKKRGEPLDRVLRIQEIAWEPSPERRARLEKVATRWFGYEGDFSANALRIAVVSDCQQSAPAS